MSNMIWKRRKIWLVYVIHVDEGANMGKRSFKAGILWICRARLDTLIGS